MPSGCITPLVVFDWIHVGALSAENKEKFYTDNAKLLYHEGEAESRAGRTLSSHFRGKFGLNDRTFPNITEIHRFIRVRMTLAPNETVGFSNKDLLTALGFSATQLPPTYKNQYRFRNESLTSYKTILCQSPPKIEEKIYSTKIHVYPTQLYTTMEGVLETTKAREKNPAHMADDYGMAIKLLGQQMNFNLSLTHNETDRQFKLTFPAEPMLKVAIKLPTFIAYRLGYGHVNAITSDMNSVPYPSDEVAIENVDSISKVLVYDTGMVVISLDQLGSQQTHQFTNAVMAILESDPAGIMTTKPGLEFPRVAVSQFNPQLDFILHKYSEANQPIPLGWKVGGYIRGLLVGKV